MPPIVAALPTRQTGRTVTGRPGDPPGSTGCAHL